MMQNCPDIFYLEDSLSLVSTRKSFPGEISWNDKNRTRTVPTQFILVWFDERKFLQMQLIAAWILFCFGKHVMCVVKLCCRIRIATRSRISCIKMCTCTRVNPSSYNRQYAYNTINVHMKIHSFLWGSDCHANMISATLIIQYKSGLIEPCQ